MSKRPRTRLLANEEIVTHLERALEAAREVYGMHPGVPHYDDYDHRVVAHATGRHVAAGLREHVESSVVSRIERALKMMRGVQGGGNDSRYGRQGRRKDPTTTTRHPAPQGRRPGGLP